MAIMKQASVKFTYRDYVQLPEEKRFELVEGELFLVPSPSLCHQRILGKLWKAISTHVEANHLGEVFFAPCDVVLSDVSVAQPDLLFVSRERLSILTDANIQGPPDLVVEILSPSTSQRDLGIKRNLYAKYGVLEYWIVNPHDKTIEVLCLTDEGYRSEEIASQTGRLGSRLLPNLALNLSEVF